ncbi:MAG: hypothetical protein HN738_02565 [Gammaproteobacteria bacterium]|jgi:hypothetical protein|nr:hypothetical protein [Gammaproteobacteria bacterium]
MTTTTKVHKFQSNSCAFDGLIPMQQDAWFLHDVLTDIIEMAQENPKDILSAIPSWDQLEREHHRFARGQALGHRVAVEEFAAGLNETTKKKKGGAK